MKVIRIGCSGWNYRHWRERVATGKIAYVRFHGATAKYHGRYPEEGLLSCRDWIVGQARSGQAVWCDFNYDIKAHAIHDAQKLGAMVAQAAQ